MNLRKATLTIAGLLGWALVTSAVAQSSGVADQHLREDASASATAGDSPSIASASGQDAHYTIGSDDVLSISVWNEKELTESVPVRSDGNISMPLIGEIQATGKTPIQLEQDISTRLRAYVTQPAVTVTVMQMNSRKFNILGRVKKPGSYPLTTTMTVLDAIALAGGFQDFAKQGRVYVLRQNPGGGEARLPFNYRNVIRGDHPEQNVRLEPHDTIVVP
jgi:polysaccharide biosynthesis/export protein